MNIAKDVSEKYLLNYKEVEKEMSSVIKNYLDRRKEIKNFDISVLEDYFYKTVIKLDESKISKNIFDISVAGGVYKKKDDDKLIKETNGGFMYKNKPFTVSYDENSSKNTDALIHEEQHHIQNKILESDGEFFSTNINEALKAAKDELLAFYREGYYREGQHDTWSLKPSKYTDDDDMTYGKIWRELSEEDRKKYTMLVESSTEIFNFLEDKMLFSKEEVIGILQKVPLDKWNLVKKRLERIVDLEDGLVERKKELDEKESKKSELKSLSKLLDNLGK